MSFDDPEFDEMYNSSRDGLSAVVAADWSVTCPRPECGWSGSLHDCGVLGAEEGFVFCRGCCGEFMPIFAEDDPEPAPRARRKAKAESGPMLPFVGEGVHS